MPEVTVLLVIGLSSLAGYFLGARRFGLSRPELAAAVRATVEAIGMAIVFFVANLGLSALAIVLARTVTGRFVSAYSVDELALAVVSLLQGFFFRWWWGTRR